MAKRAPRPLIDLLGGFLRRNAPSLSDDLREKRLNELAVRRMNVPRSTRPFVLPPARGPRVPDGAIVADELSAVDVRARLDQLRDYVVAQVVAGELPHVDLPDLHRNNCVYDARGHVFLGHATRRLAFDRQGCERFLRLLVALEKASDNLRDDAITTKRGLFYAHRAQLPDDDQLDTDRALIALANVLRVRRRSLGFVAARRGGITGRLVIRQGSEVIDLAKVGSMCPRFEECEIVSSDAAVIAVIEKDSVATRLAQERWWDDARAIMVWGSGCGSFELRAFVRKLQDTLGIPAIVVADADPSGVRLALGYAHGAITSALETPWLACNGLTWAGFRPSEIEPLTQKRHRISLSAEDREAAELLLAHPSRTYVNDRVRAELEALLAADAKVELDALMHSPGSLGDYLNRKLERGDLIAL